MYSYIRSIYLKYYSWIHQNLDLEKNFVCVHHKTKQNILKINTQQFLYKKTRSKNIKIYTYYISLYIHMHPPRFQCLPRPESSTEDNGTYVSFNIAALALQFHSESQMSQLSTVPSSTQQSSSWSIITATQFYSALQSNIRPNQFLPVKLPRSQSGTVPLTPSMLQHSPYTTLVYNYSIPVPPSNLVDNYSTPVTSSTLVYNQSYSVTINKILKASE